MLLPIIGLFINLRGSHGTNAGAIGRFLGFAVFALLAAGILTAVEGICGQVDFTIFSGAVSQLWLYGVVGMAFFAAIYYIAPRVTGLDLQKPGMVSVHFGLAALGLLIFVIAFAVGGFKHGSAMTSAGTNFVPVVKANMPFVGASTAGLLLIVLGNLVLFMNMICILRRHCLGCCRCACDEKEGAR
jgi:cytochrome c oxidase cbb3-type subunit 1